MELPVFDKFCFVFDLRTGCMVMGIINSVSGQDIGSTRTYFVRPAVLRATLQEPLTFPGY